MLCQSSGDLLITTANRYVFLRIAAFSLAFNVAIVVFVAVVIIIVRTKIFKHPKAAICINKPVDFMWLLQIKLVCIKL